MKKHQPVAAADRKGSKTTVAESAGRSEPTERIVSKIDRNEAAQIFKQLKVPAEKIEMACDRLENLVNHVNLMAQDISATKAIDDRGIRPQKQREKFINLAEKLEDIADEIRDLDLTRQRFHANRVREFHLPPVGVSQFKRAVGPILSNAFDPTYLAKFGIDVAFPQKNVEPRRISPRGAESSPSPEYMAAAIEAEAVSISADLIRQIAKGLRHAGAHLKADTKRGGPRPNLVRDAVLLNLIALWRDTFERTVYFDETHPLLEYCEALCGLLGVNGFCTEHHLKVAIGDFNDRFGRKPKRKND